MASSSHGIPGTSLTPRLVLGAALAIFGVVLLLGRLDIFDADEVLRFWPVILIVIGLQQFFNPRVPAAGTRGYPINAIIWMAVGGILLLNNLGILHASLWDLFWPVILIAIGLRLMRRGGGAGAFARPEGSDVGAMFAILSGVKRVAAPEPFQGTEVTVFMGGAHLDLRQATLAPGAEAVVDMFTVIGGCELLIPADWVVSTPIVTIMGGVDDKRLVPPPLVIDGAAMPPRAAPRLVIRGFMMMGGVTLRS
jgi:predicted membrane protein